VRAFPARMDSFRASLIGSVWQSLLQLLPWVRPLQRADARIVKHQLPRGRLLGLAQAAIELENVGNVLANLVAGAVAADDVAHRDSGR